MKKYFLIMSTTTLLLIGGKGFAQGPKVPDPNVILPLPTAAALGKYGDVPIGLYTGTLQLKVDLYTYKSKGLSVPVYLSYASNGVRVDQEDTKTGIDWSLNAGGVITRTVYGNGRTQVIGGGQIAAPPVSTFGPGTSNPDALKTWFINNNQINTSSQLDEFNFNFNGYSGKFILPNGVPVQTQYSNLKIEYNGSNPGNSWYFRITTPDGIKYYFGESNAVDGSQRTTSTINGGLSLDANPVNQITAFYLTKIEHPFDASDVIHFNYTPQTLHYTSNVEAYTRFIEPYCPCVNYTSCEDPPCIYGGPERWSGGEEAYAVTAFDGSSMRLDEITSDKYGKVKFKYGKSAGPGNTLTESLLNGIEVYAPGDLNHPLKSYSFDYLSSAGDRTYPSFEPYFAPGTSGASINMENRDFLNHVREKDANGAQVRSFVFDYYDIDGMAPRLSFAQDGYGFFNGQKNTRFIPLVDAFQTDHNLPVANRSTNYLFAQKGMIRQVTYPTGGTSTFTYAAQAYGVGGVVISKVENYDPVSQVTNVKKYDYTPGSNPYTPVYRREELHQNNLYTKDGGGGACIATSSPVMCTYVVLSSSSIMPLSGRGGVLQYYSQVDESDGANYENGGVEHFFNHGAFSPLQLLQGQPIYGITAPTYDWKWSEETTTNYFKTISGNRIYVKKISNNYLTDPRINGVYTQYAINKEDFRGFAQVNQNNPPAQTLYDLSAYDLVRYDTKQEWNYLNSQTVTTYDTNGSNPVVVTNNFFYDNPAHAMLTRTETKNSRGEVLQKVDKYVGDQTAITGLSSAEIDGINKLQNQYRIAALLETVENKNSNFISKMRTNYIDWGSGLVEPENIMIQKGTNAIERRLDYQRYDTRGNILQFSKGNGPRISYQWGYDGVYPVAEVKNAPVNDIFYESFEEGAGNGTRNDSKSGHYSYSGSYTKTVSGLDNGSYTLSYWLKINGATPTWALQSSTVNVINNTYIIGPFSGQIDDIRLYPVGSLMTSYTYDPLIGITSIMDPSGKVEYYDYDSFSRLRTIKDRNGKIIKAFCYNYAGQSANCFVPQNNQPQFIYAKLIAGTPAYTIYPDNNQNGYTYVANSNISVQFFQDAACTIPLVLASSVVISVNDKSEGSASYATYPTTNTTYTYNVAAGQSSFNLGTITVASGSSYYNDGQLTQYSSFSETYTLNEDANHIYIVEQ